MWTEIPLTGKDVFLLVAGFVLSIVATALWQWLVVRSDKGKSEREKFSKLWKSKLNHATLEIRSDASNEIIVRSLYWLVLGQLLLALPIVGYVFSPFGLAVVVGITGAGTIGGIACMANALLWLRRFLKLKQSTPVE